MSAATQLEHQPVGASIAPSVIDEIRRLAQDGSISRADFNSTLARLSVPARDYRSVLEALGRAGLRVVDEAASDDAASTAAEGPEAIGVKGTHEVDPGWNVDGFDHFVKSRWHEILSAEEEHQLATTMQQGRLARQALDEGRVSDPAAIRVLKRRVARGDDAETELVRRNLRLVLKEAGRLANRTGPSMSREDLFQEGVLGLSHALSKFDPSRGFKLSTYATWWIRQAMHRAIADKDRVIRLPVHKFDQVNRVKAIRASLRQGGPEPTVEAIAERSGFTRKAVKECLELLQPIGSLDRTISDSGSTLAELIADVGADPADRAVATVHADQLTAAVGSALNEKERDIVVLRFGLNGEEPRTLEQVGAMFGVTRERIRQIESKALVKLRGNAGVRALHPTRQFTSSSTAT